jgi:hypothetical protein
VLYHLKIFVGEIATCVIIIFKRCYMYTVLIIIILFIVSVEVKICSFKFFFL